VITKNDADELRNTTPFEDIDAELFNRIADGIEAVLAELERLRAMRDFIHDDALAVTYQSFGQYRTAALALAAKGETK
jgi:uncharacterized protein YciW